MKQSQDRKTLREIKLQLAEAGASKSQLRQNEVKELTKVLFDHEHIKSFIIGFYDGGYGMLVATDLRLIFVDVMPFGRVVQDDIPYSMIGSTQMEQGILFATICIFTRPKNYRFWWLNKTNASDFNKYVELQMLEHQHEDVRA